MMKRSVTSKRIFYNIFFGIFGQIATFVIGLLLPRLRIISFGSEINGLLSSISQIYTYLALLEMGVGRATVQALYKPVSENNRDDINSILSATNSYYKKTGLIYLLLVFAFAVVYPLCVKTDIDWWIIVGVILLNGLGNVLSYFFQGKYKLLLQVEGKEYIVTNMATFITLFSGLAKIILINLGCDVVTLQVVYFATCLFQVAYFGGYIAKKYKWINLKVSPNHKAISQKNSAMVHQITELVFYNTDTLILTMFCGLETVSIYSVYTMIVEAAAILIANIHKGFSYKLGQLYHSNRESFVKLYTLYEHYYTAIAFASYSIAYVCLSPFMNLYTAGMDINYALPYLPFLFIVIKLLIYSRAPSGFLISYAGHFKETQNRALIEMTINLAVSIILVQFVGIYGVLIGTIVALLYRANDMIIYANKRLLGRTPWITYKYCILYFVLFGVIMILNEYLQVIIVSYFSFFIFGIICSIVICAIYLIITFLLSYRDSMSFVKRVFMRKNF